MLNALGASLCGNCNADLTYAEEVPDRSEAQPESAPGTRPNNRACDCPVKRAAPGEECPGCGGTVPEMAASTSSATNADAPTGPGRAERPTAAPPRAGRAEADRSGRDSDRDASHAQNHRSIRLQMPGGILKPVADSMLPGRETASLAAIPHNYQGVSRRHLWTYVADREVILLDLGSRNGTWLGEVRLSPWTANRLPYERLPQTVRLGASLVIVIESEHNL